MAVAQDAVEVVRLRRHCSGSLFSGSNER